MQISDLKINETQLHNENGERIASYGVSFTLDDKHYDYSDLCTDKTRLVLLCEKLLNENIEAKILPEIFEDFLFQK